MIVMESMGEKLGTAGLNTLVCIAVVFRGFDLHFICNKPVSLYT